MARSKSRRWVGIDGEGVGRKPHRYVLLACSENGEYIERKEGLRTTECLDYLIALGKRDVRLCGYYLSYDWTMILRDLPNKLLYKLLRPELRAKVDGGFDRVYWRGYQLHFLAHAMWVGREGGRSTVIWDLGRYYQGPFIEALKAWDIAPDVQDHIAKMKARRSQFTWRQRTAIRKYCLAECEALAQLAKCLERAHDEAGIKPRGWHGPGSTAGALLARHNIGEQRGVQPPEVTAAAAIAFFGGRAEIACSGRVAKPVYAYDITSAYPHHASNLPCLEHGRWVRSKSERVLERSTHALVYGEIDRIGADWGPLPVRQTNGTIVFPSGGASGFWWRDEWLAARQWPKSRLKFGYAYVLRSECNCKPFGFIPELFAERLRVGKNTGAGKILKLALNSLYGKLAQTVGSGQYSSRVWAGMITSGTRGQVLDLMRDHKRLDSVLMVATDGVFSTEERATGPVELGGWERADHATGITLVRPGIYWTGEGKLRARGMGRDTLDEARVLLQDALDSGEQRVALPPRTAFGGARLTVYALRSGGMRRSAHYGQWHSIPTRVSLAPGPKRRPNWDPHKLSGVESAPYGAKGSVAAGKLFEILEQLREHTR
jgi:hypothetical protein